MMHSTANPTIAHSTARRIPALGAALLAIAGNVLVVAILGIATLVTLGAAAYVFGASLF